MSVRFLIVDDYSAHLRLMANIISYLGGVMRCAENGHDALEHARAEEFDIVLMDLQMPGLGGVATADRLMHGWKEMAHRPRIVAVTADNTPGRRALCRAIGMDGFIAKPYDADVLKSALQKVILTGHCWESDVPERTLDMKRFLNAAATGDFESWAGDAEANLGEAFHDEAACAEMQQQAHRFGFLALARALQKTDALESIEHAAVALRHAVHAGREALSMSRDLMLAAA